MTKDDMAENGDGKESMSGERIAKVLARAGLCSRREAERWIAAGRVVVNGRQLDSPAVTVTADDQVVVDGEPLPGRSPTRLWRYHKPPGLVTTHSDPERRATVFSRLPVEIGRVISVGRLDLNTEGLLLLTNDGELAREMELPSRGWTRRYRVRVYGTVDEDRLAGLARGVTVDGVRYRPVRAVVDSTKGRNSWLTITLTEGKNREIRQLMESLNLQVTRLIRISYGPFQLGHLKRGEVVLVPPRVLREQLGVGSAPAPRGYADHRGKP